MKFWKSIICALAVSLSLSSCNDWLDVNTDPNTPSAAAAKIENLLPFCQHHLLYAYAAQGYRSQFICQAFTATSRTTRDGCSAQWEATTSMCTTPYQNFFVCVGPNVNDMYTKAMAQQAWHYAGAARLIRAYGFALMADMYGEMPYTEALGESLTPRYDDGKTIYLGCISEIDEAIELFQKAQPVDAVTLATGDSWNNGDVSKWLKMAYLLKARMLNHMSKKAEGSYKDGFYDQAAILDCLSKAQQSNADNTLIEHYDMPETSTDVLVGDPLQTSPMFDNAGMGGGATTRPTQWLVDILTNFNSKGIEDPRADLILPWIQVNNPNKWERSKGVEMRTAATIRLNQGPFALSRNSTDAAIESTNAGTVNAHSWYCNTDNTDRLGDTAYVGFRSGAIGYYKTNNVLYTKGYDDGYAESSSNVFCRPTSPTQWSTYAEACFIKAEVLFRQGNKGGAFEAYKNGIQASIDVIQEAQTIWSSDRELGEMRPFQQMPQDKINAFMTNAIGDAGSITLEMIMTQKFIAMLYTQENWNDMRRMDYQNYQGWAKPYELSVNGVAQGRLGDKQEWRRIMQCSHELNYNSSNLEEVFQRLGYGVSPTNSNGTVWAVPVWWDKAEQ